MIEIRTLRDGGQTAQEIADELFRFLEQAERSLDIAIYDIRVGEAIERSGRDVLQRAVERGVKVRLVYELEEEGRDPLPAPPTTNPTEIEAEPFPTHGVATTTGLMHHKYIVRDGHTVWTGSTNFTEDSWTRQENVIAVIESERLATAYTLNFEELWKARDVESTGDVEPRPIEVGAAIVRPWFCPGYGEALAHRIAKHLGKAKKRIRIASPVLSSGPILATLVEIVNERRCDVAGVVDDTQLDQVFFQWKTNGVSEWKIPLLHTVHHEGRLLGQGHDPLDARLRARLHARQGDRRRRHLVHRVVQPLAVGRAKRGERRRDQGRRNRRPAGGLHRRDPRSLSEGHTARRAACGPLSPHSASRRTGTRASAPARSRAPSQTPPPRVAVRPRSRDRPRTTRPSTETFAQPMTWSRQSSGRA